jgi:ribokinase
MKLPLLVLGDFAWDVLIRTNTELLKGGDTYGEVMLTPGGSAANVAVWAQRAGLPTGFIGKIGRDRFGQLAEEDLADEGVQAYFVSTDAQLTGSVAVFVDETGERSMVSGRGADHYLLPSELPKKLLQDCRHLHLTAWSFFTDPPRTAAREAARIAREAGATISLDPGSFQLIGEMGVDTFLGYTQDLGMSVFMPNHEEGNVLTGETEPLAIVERLAQLYPGCLIILTLDAEGALVFEDGVATHMPPADGQLTDATGAGDSFAGAFLSRWLAGSGTLQAVEFAILISAWVIERLGARPKPDERLQKILQARTWSDAV